MIAVTLGDPAGIGPEVIAKAIRQPDLKNRGPFLLIGDQRVFQHYVVTIPSNCSFFDLKTIGISPAVIGKPNHNCAFASLEYLDCAIRLLKVKKVKALVTAPVSKEGISYLGKKFEGHTEYIANAFHIKNFAMMFASEQMRVVIATRHIALRNVPTQITPQQLRETITLVISELHQKFKVRKPKIAVCGINPHAGERGLIGQEELIRVIPAIRKLRNLGHDVIGPLPADTLFYPPFAKKYDCIIAMYHDQGLIPIKALYFDQLVNITLGLPFVRTSPAHGTAFDIAGKNKADPSSMTAAIALAAKLSR